MAIAAKGEPAGMGEVNLLAHINTIVNAQATLVDHRFLDSDLRYQQRYDAQQKALEAALLAAEKAVQAALVAAEKAVTKAELAAEKRFEAVNEFRGQLADQANTFLPRTEYDGSHKALSEKLADLASRQDRSEGNKQGGFDARTAIVGMVFLVITVVGFVVGFTGK